MKKYGKLLILVLFLVPITVLAEDCSPKDRVNLSKIAQNVAVAKVFDENTATFKLVFSNVTSEIYLYDVTGRNYHYSSNADISLKGYYPGSKYKFIFYSNAYGCEEEVIYTKYITFPNYNALYKDESCRGLEDYKICKKWANVDISYDDFKKETQKLKEKEEEKIESVQNIKGYFDYIIDFVMKYDYILLPIFIAIFIGLEYVMWYKNKKEQFF